MPTHILVANDNSLFLRVMQRMLLQLRPDVSVSVVGDGRATLEALAHQKVQLLILDCYMPYLSGLDVTRVVRSQHEPPPILLISGDPEMASAALQAGAAQFLALPFTLKELDETLTMLLATS